MEILEPYVGAFWSNREITFGRFVDEVRAFLLTLQTIDTTFDRLWVLGHRADDEVALDADLTNLESIALDRGWDRKAPTAWFTHLSADGTPTRESTSRVGWGLAISTEREAEKDRSYVYLSIRTGSRRHCSVMMKLSSQNPELLQPPIATKLFTAVVTSWRPDCALFTEASFRDATQEAPTNEQLGWLNYRSTAVMPGLDAILLASVKRDSVANGLLFRIGDGSLLTSDSHAEVAEGLKLQSLLRAAE